MTTSAPVFRTTLSHAEFSYLLKQVDSDLSIGVDRNPLDGLPEREIALAHIVARDALRARDLVRLDVDQAPLIQTQLLQTLQAYADPRQMVRALRYTSDDELPTAFFGYLHNGQTVTHTRPDDLLHELTLYNSPVGLLSSLVAFCTDGQVSAAPRQLSLALPGSTMAKARNHAENGRPLEIIKVLSEANVPAETATMLASDLVSPSTLTAITLFAIAQGGDLLRRECIYWQSEANHSALLIVYAGTPDQSVDQVLISDGDEQ